MAILHFAKREVEAKIVFWGPALSGKTTTLKALHRVVPPGERGDLQVLDTSGDRTLFFDYLPVNRGVVAGFDARFKVFSVPGQPVYRETRRQILKGVDAVVFVADSSSGRLEDNLESIEDLREALLGLGRSLEGVPFTLQYNKRDVPGALPIEQLEASLNPMRAPSASTVAIEDHGVLDSLALITRQVSSRVGRDLASSTPSDRLRVGQGDDEVGDDDEVREHIEAISRVRGAEDRRVRGSLRGGEEGVGAADFAERYPMIYPKENGDNVFNSPSDRVVFVPRLDGVASGLAGPEGEPDLPTESIERSGASPISEASSRGREERRIMAWRPTSNGPLGFKAARGVDPREAGFEEEEGTQIMGLSEGSPVALPFGEGEPTQIIPAIRDPSASFMILEERMEDFASPSTPSPPAAQSPKVSPPVAPVTQAPQTIAPSKPPVEAQGPVAESPRAPSPGRSVNEDSGLFSTGSPEILELPYLSALFVGHRVSGVHGSRLGAGGAVEIRLTLTSRISGAPKPVLVRLQPTRSFFPLRRFFSPGQILREALILLLGGALGAALAWRFLGGWLL